jgi:hypothetical protein
MGFLIGVNAVQCGWKMVLAIFAIPIEFERDR